MHTIVKKLYNLLLVLALLLLGAATAHAAIINPLPTDFGADNGAELFTPVGLVGSVEFYDLAGNLSPGAGASFGFYFDADPGTLIPVFTGADQGLTTATALIDFGSGIVLDLDASAVLTTFSGTGNIGFWLALNGLPIIYTEANLNPFNLDLAATFPSLATPNTYLIGFETFDATGASIPLAFEIVSNIKAVPEPGTLLLLFGGLILFVPCLGGVLNSTTTG